MVTADDEEVAVDEATDEFAEHFDRSRPPKVLITTCYKPSGIMYKFLAEMLQVRPRDLYSSSCFCYYCSSSKIVLARLTCQASSHVQGGS